MKRKIKPATQAEMWGWVPGCDKVLGFPLPNTVEVMIGALYQIVFHKRVVVSIAEGGDNVRLNTHKRHTLSTLKRIQHGMKHPWAVGNKVSVVTEEYGVWWVMIGGKKRWLHDNRCYLLHSKSPGDPPQPKLDYVKKIKQAVKRFKNEHTVDSVKHAAFKLLQRYGLFAGETKYDEIRTDRWAFLLKQLMLYETLGYVTSDILPDWCSGKVLREMGWA